MSFVESHPSFPKREVILGSNFSEMENKTLLPWDTPDFKTSSKVEKNQIFRGKRKLILAKMNVREDIAMKAKARKG